MSFFSSVEFFLILGISLIPAIIIGLMEKNLKYYRIFLILFFIYLVYGNSLSHISFLLSYVVLSIIVVKGYSFLRKSMGRNRYIYLSSIFVVLLPLVVSKVGLFLGDSIFGFLGLSYIFFRVIQVIIEIYDGVIEDVDIIQFAEFLLFFPSLSSGPIDRSRRFNEDDNKIYSKQEYNELLSIGITKIVRGVMYKFALSGFFSHIMAFMVGQYDILHIVGYSYSYGFYMFFDFAGYCLMAIGTSYILGIKMPENFNKPFISVDIKDFWNRWHISLSHWFRDFIFTRFLLNSVRKKRFKDRLVAACVGLLLNMTLMGIWHGLDLHYIMYGVYHGVLLVITEVYQKKSKFYKANKKNKVYRLCSWFITINLVMFGFLIFSGEFKACGLGFLKYLQII